MEPISRSNFFGSLFLSKPSSISFFCIAVLCRAVNVCAEESDTPLLSESVTPNSDVGWIERYVDAKSEAFSASDIKFARARNNAPFMPFAYLGGAHYGDAAVQDYTKPNQSIRYQQNSSSFASGLPFLLNNTDAAILGVYAGRSHFSVSEPQNLDAEDFTVTSLAIGAGYFTQYSDNWQAAAFMLPFYNDSDLANGGSYWQTMGGVFARYTQSPDIWWAFGLFADTSPFDTYMLPYVGFSWTLDQEWTISGIMPWPKVMWAPSKDWFVAFGGTISGAAWAVDQGSGEVGMDMNAFDLGLEYQHRIYGALWGSLSAGVGGLRVLQIEDGGDVQGPEFDISRSPFVRLNFTIRPDALF